MTTVTQQWYNKRKPLTYNSGTKVLAPVDDPHPDVQNCRHTHARTRTHTHKVLHIHTKCYTHTVTHTHTDKHSHTKQT